MALVGGGLGLRVGGDLSWRAIVLKPERGDVFVLLWVDHDDEAMDWARNRWVEIDPDTGALQVFAGVTVTEAVVQPTSPTPDAPAPLFDAFRDRELMRLGAPEGALPGVRAVRTRAALDALRPALPADAFESLGWLADGEPYADVERIVAAASAPTPLPAADFAALTVLVAVHVRPSASLWRFTTATDPSIRLRHRATSA